MFAAPAAALWLGEALDDAECVAAELASGDELAAAVLGDTAADDDEAPLIWDCSSAVNVPVMPERLRWSARQYAQR